MSLNNISNIYDVLHGYDQVMVVFIFSNLNDHDDKKNSCSHGNCSVRSFKYNIVLENRTVWSGSVLEPYSHLCLVSRPQD